MTNRAGIVGCGRIGSGFDDSHAAAYLAASGVTLAALCDAAPDKLADCGGLLGVCAQYRDYKEMLAREKLDILSIATWNGTHLDITKAAVAAGVRAIFCEKPIADTLAHADEMIALCARHDVLLQVDHQRRFHEFYRQLRQMLAAGALGQIQQVSFYYCRGIANTGSHVFDLLRFLFGEVAWVQADRSRNQWESPDDPNFDVTLRFQSGAHGTVRACDDRHFFIFELDIIGSTGRLNISRNGSEVAYHAPRDSENLPGLRELYTAPSPVTVTPPGKLVQNAVAHLVACLDGGAASVSSGADGRAALELICACYESAAAAGCRVTLPLKKSLVEIRSQ